MGKLKISLMLAASVCLIISTALLLKYITKYEDNYVAVVDGDKILLAEFAVYLSQTKTQFEETGGADIWETEFGGDTAENVAKQIALDGITFVRISAAHGRKTGLSLTASEKKDAEEAGRNFFGQLSPKLIEENGITEKVVIAIMEENFMHQKTYEEVTKNYTPADKKSEMYQGEYKRWSENVKVAKNTTVWDSILIENY